MLRQNQSLPSIRILSTMDLYDRARLSISHGLCASCICARAPVRIPQPFRPLGYFTPVTFDADISQRLLWFLRLLENPSSNRLEAQSVFLHTLADLFVRHAQPHLFTKPVSAHPGVIQSLRTDSRQSYGEYFADEIARRGRRLALLFSTPV